MGTKPLIFLRPLSDRLSQLKESIESTAEEENIEIYDIESLEELNQIIHHMGQFLLLTSTPKLCANFLQINSRKIRKDQSKIILISAQYFPPKIVDRLNKLGLTDLILESVAPKTLQYKVKLQLRSITAQVEEEEEKNEVHIKHDEEEAELKSEVKSADLNDENSKKDALLNLKKKILESDSNKEKSYPGKASLVIEDDMDPETVVGGFNENGADEEDDSQIESKTLIDVEKENAEKKKNLPWHKAKEENLKSKGSSEKINNVWSNKKESPTDATDEDPGSLEGKSSTDKLQKDRAGKVGEKEKSIATHWGGKVTDAKKENEKEDSEQSNNKQKIEKHYEGSTKDQASLNQDFETADSSFEENKNDSMTGDSKGEKAEGNLVGESIASKINSDLLQTDSEGIDTLGPDFTGENKNKENPTQGNMVGNAKMANINDELEANVEELRSLNKNSSLKIDPSLNKFQEKDLKADLNSNEKLDRNLTNDSKATKIDTDEMGSRLKKENATDPKKTKRTSLLDQIKKNKSNKRENVDGFMRSPKARSRAEEIEKEEKALSEEIDMATPLGEKTPAFSPSDFASDLFEDDEGVAETENQENASLSGKGSSEEYDDDLEGENNSNEELEGMTGESERSDEFEDLKGKSNKAASLAGYQGESKVDQIEGDALYGSTDSKCAPPQEEEEEELAKKRRKLEELYALKDKKLQELQDKKKKAAALNTEEDYYKKERDWDENSFSMDSEKRQKEAINLSQTEKKKSGQENLEAKSYEKSNRENLEQKETLKKESYSEDVLEERSRHHREEIELDQGSLTDMERELINSNKDWGEQTIDYSKMKAGQEAISTDRESSGKGFDLKLSEKEIPKEQKVYKGSVLAGDLEEEIIEEEGENIIHPDAKGLESVVNILNLYFDQDIKPSQVLNKTADLINSEKGLGVVSFFYKKYKTEEFTEILNGHSLFSNDQRLEMWEDDKKLMVNNWASVKLPTWSDKTFRENKVDFIYPYYEGIDQLGFAVVNFSHGMKSENASRIEITLEAARSVYLTQRHKENGDEAIYTEKKVIPTEHPVKASEEGFMRGSDNLIILEKAKAEIKAKEAKENEQNAKSSVVKKLWKRMFG